MAHGTRHRQLHWRTALGFGLIPISLLAFTPAPATAAQCAGVTMPARIDVGTQRLVLNGLGLREATIFNVDVYVAGLYLPAPSRDGAQVLSAMDTMRLTLRLVRDVERGKMAGALHDGLKRNAGKQMPSFEATAAELERLIPDLHKGDTVTFTFVPQGPGVLTVDVNGRQQGRVYGTEFARAFFGIWLRHPPNADLKRGLLGGRCD